VEKTGVFHGKKGRLFANRGEACSRELPQPKLMPSRLNPSDLRPSTSRSAFKQLVIERAIHASALFCDLPIRDLAPLVDLAWLKTLQKGEHLYYQGSRSYGFYIVHTGAIRLYRVNAKGDEQVLHVARPAESFAEESLFSEAGHALTAAAIQSTTLVALPRNEFLALLRNSPELGLSLLRIVSSHLRKTITLVEDLRLKSARTRLANWLVEHCPEPAGPEPQMISLSVPKGVLAAELGMASETFSRALADFQEQDLLDVQGRVLTVLHPDELELVAQEQQASTCETEESETCLAVG